MRAPLSWLREYVEIPIGEVPTADEIEVVSEHLVRAGLEVDAIEIVGGEVVGPLVVGRVLAVDELTEFKKPIRFCRVEVGALHGHRDTPGERGIVCGASNFVVGDLVVVALPGAQLPGGFLIASRETYGHVSDGMICSERELGLGQDHDGILVLPPGTAVPGADAGSILGLGDIVFDLAVTPDIGYCLSMRGIARELATAFDVALRDPGTELVDLPAATGDNPYECRVQDPAGCDLFTLRTIVGFDPGAPTPYWMRRRLAACGMRSLSLAVDVTNYVMLETGQPLHAFDAAKLRGPIVVRRAEAGESLETLDHVVRSLGDADLLITDDRGPIGLAGVMGGLDTEVDATTTRLALEAAHFDAAVVARMGRRHKLTSEASRRFERGVDRVLAPYASGRATELLLTYGGGEYVGMTAVESAYRATTIELAADLPERTAGIAIDREAVIARLEAVGATVGDADGVLVVTPPTWRPDLTDPADLVEEVLRLGGYDAIPSTLPRARAGYGLTEGQRLRRRVARELAAFGCTEVLSYPFIGSADLDALGIPKDDPRHRMLLLANPLSDEAPGMRTTLIPGLLAALRRNVGRGQEDLSLVEIGAVFRLNEGQDPRGVTDPPRPSVDHRPSEAELSELAALLPHEARHAATAFCGRREAAGWWGPGDDASWADAIESARVVARAVGADLDVRAGATPMPLHPGRCAELVLNTPGADAHVVGYAGELHPRVVAAWGLPARTAVMELDLGVVLVRTEQVVMTGSLSNYPVAKEDLALVVDSTVPAARVEAALREGAGDLLESLRLFDVYTGSQLPEGKKSLAYALRLRAPDRTLTVDEVTAVREAAVARAAAQVGAALRGAPSPGEGA